MPDSFAPFAPFARKQVDSLKLKLFALVSREGSEGREGTGLTSLAPLEKSGTAIVKIAANLLALENAETGNGKEWVSAIPSRIVEAIGKLCSHERTMREANDPPEVRRAHRQKHSVPLLAPIK